MIEDTIEIEISTKAVVFMNAYARDHMKHTFNDVIISLLRRAGYKELNELKQQAEKALDKKGQTIEEQGIVNPDMGGQS